LDLKEYGFDPSILPEYGDGTPARVTAVHRDRYELVCPYGECSGRLKPGVYYTAGDETFPTTGDFVLIDYHSDGDSRIIKTLPRRSKFVRNDFSGHAAGYVKTVLEQVVAANFDYVLILQSLNANFSPRRLERYVALAWQSGAVPVILLTKTDLNPDYFGQLRAAESIADGVEVHAVSAITGAGLDTLAKYLKPGRTVVLLGSSGVGKSSLVNALAGKELMAVNDIREDDKGRHTTTHRQLLMMPGGFMVIDTPGMRELGMWDAAEGLEDTFADVERYLGSCRFSDCRHAAEPGCAVRAAIESGALTQDRWDSYLRLKQELRFTDVRAGSKKRGQQHFEPAKWERKRRNGKIQLED